MKNKISNEKQNFIYYQLTHTQKKKAIDSITSDAGTLNTLLGLGMVDSLRGLQLTKAAISFSI